MNSILNNFHHLPQEVLCPFHIRKSLPWEWNKWLTYAPSRNGWISDRQYFWDEACWAFEWALTAGYNVSASISLKNSQKSLKLCFGCTCSLKVFSSSGCYRASRMQDHGSLTSGLLAEDPLVGPALLLKQLVKERNDAAPLIFESHTHLSLICYQSIQVEGMAQNIGNNLAYLSSICCFHLFLFNNHTK